MTLRESVGGDVQRIYDQVDALLDSEDGLLVLCDGNRMVSYTQGFGVTPCQLELLGVELERAVRNVVGRQPTTNRREGGIVMEKLRVFGLLMLPTAAVTGLLVLYFDWRARLLSPIRDERNEYRKAA